jgi:Carboxylesterase family
MKRVEEGPIVGTRVGRLRGMREPGFAVFRGSPYAAAPFGERHWRATEPHPGWMVVRNATVYGPIAPQPVGLLPDEVLGRRALGGLLRGGSVPNDDLHQSAHRGARPNGGPLPHHRCPYDQ